jgi:hypothetical protein
MENVRKPLAQRGCLRKEEGGQMLCQDEEGMAPPRTADHAAQTQLAKTIRKTIRGK